MFVRERTICTAGCQELSETTSEKAIQSLSKQVRFGLRFGQIDFVFSINLFLEFKTPSNFCQNLLHILECIKFAEELLPASSSFCWVIDRASEISCLLRAGDDLQLGGLTFEAPRYGPTVWEIGYPDRIGSGYIPDPNPLYPNRLFVNFEKWVYRSDVELSFTIRIVLRKLPRNLSPARLARSTA